MRPRHRTLEPLVRRPTWRDSLSEGAIALLMISSAFLLVAALACIVVASCS